LKGLKEKGALNILKNPDTLIKEENQLVFDD